MKGARLEQAIESLYLRRRREVWTPPRAVKNFIALHSIKYQRSDPHITPYHIEFYLREKRGIPFAAFNPRGLSATFVISVLTREMGRRVEQA